MGLCGDEEEEGGEALSPCTFQTMNRNSKFLIVIFSISLAGAAAGAFIYFSPGLPSHSLLPDANLVATFQGRRVEFERLRQMTTEDLNTESYFSESHLDSKLSDLRRQEYRELIAKIQHGLIVTTDYDETVRFVIAGGGVSAISPGWLKGIEYVPGSIEKKGTLLPGLDSANTLPAGVYLREIEPHWFIVYQRTSD